MAPTSRTPSCGSSLWRASAFCFSCAALLHLWGALPWQPYMYFIFNDRFSGRSRVLSILHLLRQLLPRLYPRSQREKDRKKRIIDVLYDCYHLYAEDPDPNPEFEQLEAFTHFVYKQMEANKVKVWRGVVAAGLRECPYATSITWHLVSNLIGENEISTKSLK